MGQSELVIETMSEKTLLQALEFDTVQSQENIIKTDKEGNQKLITETEYQKDMDAERLNAIATGSWVVAPDIQGTGDVKSENGYMKLTSTASRIRKLNEQEEIWIVSGEAMWLKKSVSISNSGKPNASLSFKFSIGTEVYKTDPKPIYIKYMPEVK